MDIILLGACEDTHTHTGGWRASQVKMVWCKRDEKEERKGREERLEVKKEGEIIGGAAESSSAF